MGCKEEQGETGGFAQHRCIGRRGRRLARISHQPSATTVESSRHSKGTPCSSTLKCEYTSASDSRRETPGLTGTSPSRDEVDEKSGLELMEGGDVGMPQSESFSIGSFRKIKKGGVTRTESQPDASAPILSPNHAFPRRWQRRWRVRTLRYLV